MMVDTFILTVREEDAGERIDRVVSESGFGLTRSGVQRIIESGGVTVDSSPVGKNYRVKANEKIVVRVPEAQPLEMEPEEIPLEIPYEDRDLLVVNKPKGMVVHPAPGNPNGTLVNALLYHCGDSLSGINGVIRPGIVHRIDKDTSGLLVVAKNDMAHIYLAKQIKEHSFTRAYEAVVYGDVKQESGTVSAPIGRHATDRKKMAVTARNSRDAVTHFQVIERFGQFTHLRLTLETGRTHQIRVHMAYIGHPVAGDPVYGPKKVITSLGGQCLHAKLIGFIHPVSGQYLEIDSALPEYFKDFLKKL